MARNPLALLKSYKSLVTADLVRMLKRAQKDIKAQIALAAAKAGVATSAKEREALYAEIEAQYKALAEGLDAQIKTLLGKAAKAGHDAAVDDLGGAAKTVRYDPARNERYFRMVHPSNSSSLAAVFTDKMSESAVGSLRAAFVSAFREGTVKGMTANEMQRLLRDRWDALAADGNDFRFVDRSGRRWENARYLQMLVETNAQRVAIESSIDTCADNGITLMQISDDGDEDCAVCAAWEGRIIQTAGKSEQFPTYDEARAAGVFHPNCLHRPLPVDELLDEDEINRQSRLKKPSPDAMKDPAVMQAQKDQIDESRYTDAGQSPEDARRSVTADRLERAIRAGTFSDAAAGAARMLRPADLDTIRAAGIPRFEPVRNKEQPGRTRTGKIMTPRDPSADDILNLLGFARGPEDQPAPRSKPVKLPPFPEDPDNMMVIRGLGGSTGAELVEDAYGQRFVRKRGGAAGSEAAEHVRSEAAADEAYRALGVDVPAFRLYERNGKPPVKLSQYIDGAQSLGDYLAQADAEGKRRVLEALQRDFDVDVLFGNRDVIGASRDNVLVDKEGRPWRIDNGAAFGWRAQGARKSDWTKWPDEITSMPAAAINKGVFDKVSIVDTVIRSAQRDYESVAEIVPQRDRAVFRERAKEMRALGLRAQGFRDTGYTDGYNAQVIEHSYALSKEGFREAVPKSVKQHDFGNFRSPERQPTAANAGPGGMPSDWQAKIVAAAISINHHAKGKTSPNAATVSQALAMKPALEKLLKSGAKNAEYWVDAVNAIEKAAASPGAKVGLIDTGVSIAAANVDEIRQAGSDYSSLTAHVHDYIKRAGGSPSFVTDWQESQAGHSWNKDACLRKVVQELARPLPEASTWVTDDIVKRQYYDSQKTALRDNPTLSKKATLTFAAYDAAVQLALENCAFEHRDADRRELILLRSEARGVMREYGVTDKQAGELVKFPRGACESHSVFSATVISGRNFGTMVRVPFPLVKGLYFFERVPGAADSAFYGDGENEFTCDSRDLDTTPIGTVTSGQVINLTKYKAFATLIHNEGT